MPNHTSAEELLRDLIDVRERLIEAEQRLSGAIAATDPAWHASARNLVHYVALRQLDLRKIQVALASMGLSSLGRSEAHVLASIDGVLGLLRRAADQPSAEDGAPIGFEEGRHLLEEHARALLGPTPEGRDVRIMVTLPDEAATDPAKARALVETGMDVARINAAHGDAERWRRMAANVRQASTEVGRPCRIELDLAGPKVRTGPLAPGPQLIKWRPMRDARGRVTEPARVWLTPDEARDAPDGPASAVVALPGAWLARLKLGARVRVVDLRGKRRELRIVGSAGASRWAECEQTAYIGPETAFAIAGKGGAPARPRGIPALEQPLRLKVDDRLLVLREPVIGQPARRDLLGASAPAMVACTLPEALDEVEAGHRISFDDGRIDGVVERTSPEGVLVRITRARPDGSKLRADKGINLPDTPLRMPALSARDGEALSAAPEVADAVALSFARSVKDVEALQAALAGAPGRRQAIVLKVETQRGFEQLPRMLLAAMRTPPVGVMIARGDLAIECGYERLAEVQEELLWICEAAHAPVIWATQVLESLAKKGSPSRAEITDAAMGERAECVMLNKGPYILEAVRALDDILRRMQAHQSKKTPMLRPLLSIALD